MARIRTVKPDFYRHEELFLTEKETGLPIRVAFSGLWTVCDRQGRFRWKPRQLKLDILPYDELDFSRVLDALLTRGFIVQYGVNGELYGFIPSWERHQAINNRERPSNLPEPTQDNIINSDKNNNLTFAYPTCDSRVNDASTTPLCNAPEEREGNKKNKITNVILSKEKRRTRLPDNFEITRDHIQLALKNGWPPPQDELEAFKDYHEAKGTVFLDWNKAFHTWLRNAKKINARSNGNGTYRKSNSATHMQRLIESCTTW